MPSKRLMTAGAAAALVLAPAALAQEPPSDPVTPGNTPPDAMQTNPMEPPPASPPPGETRPAQASASTQEGQPAIVEGAVPYDQVEAEGWSTPPDSGTDADPMAPMDAAPTEPPSPMTPRPDPAMPVEPMDAPTEMEVPTPDPMNPANQDRPDPGMDAPLAPPPIDPAPDAGMDDEDPLDPTPPGA
ncbi:MAG: hypothetical protein V7678_04735 [Brevundimonas sp.]